MKIRPDYKAKNPVIHVFGATSEDEWTQLHLPKVQFSNSSGSNFSKQENLFNNPSVKVTNENQNNKNAV
jgi:hypothetical protein